MSKTANRQQSQVVLRNVPSGIKAVFVPTSLGDFDAGFPDGVFAIPKGVLAKSYNVRALDKYCSDRKISPSDLTQKELSNFLITSR